MAWFPNMRAFLTAARALQRIERHLGRIADHLEGKEPAVALDDATKAPPPDLDYDAVEDARARLTPLLGRDPDENELLRELEGQEFGDGDEPVLPAALRAMRNGGRVQ